IPDAKLPDPAPRPVRSVSVRAGLRLANFFDPLTFPFSAPIHGASLVIPVRERSHGREPIRLFHRFGLQREPVGGAAGGVVERALVLQPLLRQPLVEALGLGPLDCADEVVAARTAPATG